MQHFELIYLLSNVLLLPAWLLLIVAPEWRWTERLIHSIWIPVLYSAAVTIMVVVRPAAAEGADIGSLHGFMLLLDSPWFSLAIWLQLVLFDLFIGAWESRDARRLGIHAGWMVVPLVATYIFGPPGLLIYLVVRYSRTRSASLAEQ
ncbi:hypothetical protein HNQ60_004826 [Povalibacter uvarum]|uniref:DUF4281 domain-containing protein n=1 Tax=Povalibacter uvarum TaxID=732238 RepID=A0A841HVV7_9GAMM|nr:ABA4-like family protein [Povalibacter uvarum]MBB6095935.1 hypothetical protein [Povalibacter uvarum]